MQTGEFVDITRLIKDVVGKGNNLDSNGMLMSKQNSLRALQKLKDMRLIKPYVSSRNDDKSGQKDMAQSYFIGHHQHTKNTKKAIDQLRSFQMISSEYNLKSA